MSKLAALAGTFADFKLIRTRSVAQLVVEIPIEQADAALKALGGVPIPGRECPVALALLDPRKAGRQPEAGGEQIAPSEAAAPANCAGQPPADPARQRTPFAAMPASQQSALRCGDPMFRKWLGVPDADAAAVEVRKRAGVTSRRKLDADPAARNIWRGMEQQFRGWLTSQQYADQLSR